MTNLLTTEETWKRLDELNIPTIKASQDKWYIHGANLSGTDLSGADFTGAYLRGANFREANLKRAFFEGADLEKADFRKANLGGVCFDKANLYKANLSELDLRKVKLNDATLIRADLSGANLSGTDIMRANLSGIKCNKTKFVKADLRAARLYKTNLRQVDFKDAFLRYADFRGSDLREADLRGADLTEADLSYTDLRGANLSSAQLVESKLVGSNLLRSDITGCIVYGVSAWDVNIGKTTKMRDLIINKSNQPLMTIDDLEIAQFIYTVLNNKKIKNVIDTMRTKAVLILSSFDVKSKKVMEYLKDNIREHGYIPLIFDFSQPKSQNLMETVRTMALLSNFVIVDISIQAGQLIELKDLVPNTIIPFVTIAKKGSRTTAMLSHLSNYFWYRDKYFSYSSFKQIPHLFKNEIIPWVKKTNSEISKKR